MQSARILLMSVVLPCLRVSLSHHQERMHAGEINLLGMHDACPCMRQYCTSTVPSLESQYTRCCSLQKVQWSIVSVMNVLVEFSSQYHASGTPRET